MERLVARCADCKWWGAPYWIVDVPAEPCGLMAGRIGSCGNKKPRKLGPRFRAINYPNHPDISPPMGGGAWPLTGDSQYCANFEPVAGG